MKKIEELDNNFATQGKSSETGTKAYDACKPPFSLHGLTAPLSPDGTFFRLPPDTAWQISEGVGALCTHCAGGRIRFKTNSPYIAIRAKMGGVGKMPHFALTGSAGFDLYKGAEYAATFVPPFHITDELFGEYRTDGGEMKEYTLNFPLYSEVRELSVILDADAVVEAADNYDFGGKPIVFYGSSITQGGCASRPGTAYTAVVARRLHLDHVNLGFSGNAKGEAVMAEYIARLDMLAFVFDYDFNAPTAEHLNNTHAAFIDIVRRAHPTLPIICISAPTAKHKDHATRMQIISDSVTKAKVRGDENIYYIDMSDYLRSHSVLHEATVDGCHPNDLGFYFMAQAVEDLLKVILK